MKRGQYLLVAAGAMSALASTSGWAQDSAATLEEIIVTAEKQATDLQKTPIAITVVDADALMDAGVSQAEDINKLVPGLGIAQGGPSTQVYVRGVGNYGTNAFADPAVAFNMDGVYISRFSGISGNFFDIERVEVLKGPQGTLYGRNATGGAINIVTKKPSKEFEGGAGVELGNYSLFKANGYINVPVSESFALRFAGQRTSRDGYLGDGYNDDKSSAARVSALYTPSDELSLLVTGSYLHIGGKGPVHVPKGFNGFVDNNAATSDDPWTGLSNTIGNYLIPPGPVPALWAGVSRTDAHQDITVKGINAEFNADLGETDLTVLASHQSNVNPSKFYGPGFMVDNGSDGDKSNQNSLEARLAGNAGAVKWQAGLYHFDEKQQSHYWVDQGFVFNQTGLDMDKLKDDTNAAFSQVTFQATDNLNLTAGLRYTEEKKDVKGNIFSRQPASGSCGAATAVTISTVAAQIPQAATNSAGTAYPFTYCQDSLNNSAKWTDTSWKVGADLQVTDDSMVYATVSRGFKSGGFFAGGINSSIPQADGTIKNGNRFEPETLLAYALGSKNRFLNQRLQVNAEAFYWDYTDHQENYLAPINTSGSFNFVTQNADAEIYGLDLESDFLLTDNDRVGVKAQYLHAEYTRADFVVASPGPGNPSPLSVCPTTQNTTSPAIWYAHCAGQQMPRSPTLSGTFDYSHTFNLSNGGSVVPSVTAQYSGSYWSAVDYNPLQKQESYTTLSADLGYHAPDDAWSVTAWGANLTEEVVYTNAFMYPGNNSATGSVAMIQLAAPRTYGVRFNAKF